MSEPFDAAAASAAYRSALSVIESGVMVWVVVICCAAAGMRGIDPILIRVGRVFHASSAQMVAKVYLPAMRQPIVNGLRLGLGVAIIGALLAETKLSNQGLGYLVIQTYTTFNIPRMYALLVALFVLSIGANALIGRFGAADRAAVNGPR